MASNEKHTESVQRTRIALLVGLSTAAAGAACGPPMAGSFATPGFVKTKTKVPVDTPPVRGGGDNGGDGGGGGGAD